MFTDNQFGEVLWKVRFQHAIAFASIQTQIGLDATAYKCSSFHTLMATGLNNTGI